MKRASILLIFLALAVVGCSRGTAYKPGSEMVQMRIERDEFGENPFLLITAKKYGLIKVGERNEALILECPCSVGNLHGRVLGSEDGILSLDLLPGANYDIVAYFPDGETIRHRVVLRRDQR